MQNIFCDSDNLHNESDVEALFVEPMLRNLGYPDNRVRRKAMIEELPLPTTGARAERYRPDYVLMDSAGKPVVVIDAKSPDENPSKYRYQVTGYSLLINQRHEDNPIRYCVVSNGFVTELLEWDRQAPILVLRFQHFDTGDAQLAEFRSAIAYKTFNQEHAVKEIKPDYRRPTIREIITAFEAVHNVIRKKEKYGPTKAFYELAKLLFVKLRQDRRIHDIVAEKRPVQADDFYFTADWVNRQPTANPVATQLFRDIQNQLEAEIVSGRKKRIFGEGENIDLKPSTIVEVVHLLEGYDLHGIDEDLNGRMFETFLNTTVRGKELGQFFTPRPVVKYMTKTARLDVADRTLPRVIDACCGSGGFLIEALAELSCAINTSSQLTNAERQRLHADLQSDTLYGIEANDEIGRVARLNMYLHGDGGSRIYVADSLDKDLVGEPGLPNERFRQLEELQQRVIAQQIRFDVALTNPPFSMSYSKKETDERRILQQYEIVSGQSAHSNVLFLERYRDLLKDDGDLLTVIDDTVLNGINAAPFRRFIREHFVIRQVISLPFNAFFRAQANIKTSIIHLRRKQPGDQQGDVFMAITNNVGHDDHKHDTPHRDNLPELASLYLDWDRYGRKPYLLRANDSDEPLGCPMQVFVVEAEALSEHRLDAFYYAPELTETRNRLRMRAEAGDIVLKRGMDFNLAPRLSKKEKDSMRGSVCRYIEITSVTRDGMIVSPMEDNFEDLPTRAEFQLQPFDVLFAKNNSSRGTSVLVPEWFDGGLATSGFINVRARDEDEAFILWSVFRSELWRQQIYYLAITASQPEVRDEIFRNEMLIPWPASEEQQANVVGSAKGIMSARDQERLAVETNRQVSYDTLMG